MTEPYTTPLFGSASNLNNNTSSPGENVLWKRQQATVVGKIADSITLDAMYRG